VLQANRYKTTYICIENKNLLEEKIFLFLRKNWVVSISSEPKIFLEIRRRYVYI